MTATKSNLAETQPTPVEKEEALDRAVERIAEDAKLSPEKYLIETESPGGGE